MKLPEGYQMKFWCKDLSGDLYVVYSSHSWELFFWDELVLWFGDK